jgi:hypothetical protein
VRPILPTGALGIYQVQVCFVYQCRRLERMARGLGRHLVLGDPV